MDRFAVDSGHGRRDRRRADCILRLHRPHGDHHVPVENTCRHTGDVGDVHGDVPSLLDLPHRDLRLQQLRFKGETAPNEKTHEIIAPKMRHVREFSLQLAVFIQTVAGNVRRDIRAGGDDLQEALAHVADFQNGTRSGIALCEKKEIIRFFLGKDHQIRLRISGAHAGRVVIDLPFPDQLSYILRGHVLIWISHSVPLPLIFLYSFLYAFS